MNRCATPLSARWCHHIRRRSRHAWLAGLVATLLWIAWPAAAQQSPAAEGVVRPFPEAALRGVLRFDTTSQATVNGRAVHVAPGMRLFSTQDRLLQAHTVLGQSLTVNYLLETPTGMLHQAWILSAYETAQPRRGSDAIITNITTGSGTVAK